MNKISNRVWWSGIAIFCSMIFASGGFSQKQRPTTSTSNLKPVSDIVRTRNLEIVDKNGFARIRMSVEDDSSVSIAVVRPDMQTPVLHFVDVKAEDVAAEKEKKKYWHTELKFWNETGNYASFLTISNYGKHSEWRVLAITTDDTVPPKGEVKTTEIRPGSVSYQIEKIEKRDK
jgi:hypothetical protein